MSTSRTTTTYFDLAAPNRLLQIGGDEQQLRAVDERVAQLRQEVSRRIAARARDRAGVLQQSLERDAELEQLGRRLHRLQKLGADSCLGFMVEAATGQRCYIGRFGVSDQQGDRLLVDWRAPAAEPFFAATHQHDHGLSMRRRYRWRGGWIVDFWDEVFDPGQLGGNLSLDGHSAFLASLGEHRTGRMRDVLSTIHADQDAIIRSPSAGALVVDGGPGTGKTVVALHRAAYLMHADPRLRSNGGRVLVVSPHDAYTNYVRDILPNLGEEEVLVSTLSGLVAHTGGLRPEPDPEVQRIKAAAVMVQAVARAVEVFEQPPDGNLLIETPWADLVLGPDQWRIAVAGITRGTSHNEARTQLREELVGQLLPSLLAREPDGELVHDELACNPQLTRAVDEYWPLLDPDKLLRALYSTEALLRYSAPGLAAQDIVRLLGGAGGAWTEADLPLLDAARTLVGDPGIEHRRRRHAARMDSERQQVVRVIDDLLAAADDKEDLVSQLLSEDLQEQLLAQHVGQEPCTDPLTGPFSHVVIDEAQDLSDAQWAMVLRRCPSGSLTIVGDRAQAVAGFSGTWQQRLQRAGIGQPRIEYLKVNYRSTAQIMRAAAGQIRPWLPDANIPVSIRTDGAPVRYACPLSRERILERWLARNPQGVAAVIGHGTVPELPRVTGLRPSEAKGLEFDLVIVDRPEDFGIGPGAAVQRFVAMTRATAQLVVLSTTGGPDTDRR